MYTQIIPADGWYFRHENPVDKDAPVVWQVAVWALTQEGKVVGLIPAALGKDDPAVLYSVPPGGGQYLQENQLSELEKQASKKR